MGLGIDVGTTSVKIAEVRRKFGFGGSFRIVGTARRDISSITSAGQDVLNSVVSKVVAESLYNHRKKSAYVGLNGRDINLQLTVLPQAKPHIFRTMIKNEITQKLGSAMDLYADYCILREPDHITPQYLVMIGLGKRDFVDNRIKSVSQAGVIVREAVPVPFALYNAYINSYGVTSDVIVVLDIGAETMNLVLIRSGRLIFSRNITSGSNVFNDSIVKFMNVTPAEAEHLKVTEASLSQSDVASGGVHETLYPAVRTAAGQISGVVQSSISFAKMQLKEQDLMIDRILLSGGGARLKGLKEYLKSSLNTDVDWFNPFQNIDASSIDDEILSEVAELPTDFAPAIGLAEMSSAQTQSLTLSILPDAIKKKRQFFKTTVYMYAAIALFLIVLIVQTVSAISRRGAAKSSMDAFTKETKDIEDKINKLNELEVRKKDLDAKTRILSNEISVARNPLDAVAKLSKILPPGVWVNKIGVEEIVEESSGFDGFAVKGDRVIVISGYIDENIKNGPDAVLKDIENRLKDKSRGVDAKLADVRTTSDQPGKRVFTIYIK